MTKKSKKRRLSKRLQKLAVTEDVNDATTKVTIYKENPKENVEDKIKTEAENEGSYFLPFLFEEPEWFQNIVYSLSEHLKIVPKKVVF